MFSELEEKAFPIIDTFLTGLENSEKDLGFSTYAKPKEYLLAKDIMERHSLIRYRNPSLKMSIVDITQNGINVNKIGGIKIYLTLLNKKTEEKENLEMQDLRTDSVLKTNQLADYEQTKRQLKNSTIANIVLAVIALVELLLLVIKK